MRIKRDTIKPISVTISWEEFERFQSLEKERQDERATVQAPTNDGQLHITGIRRAPRALTAKESTRPTNKDKMAAQAHKLRLAIGLSQEKMARIFSKSQGWWAQIEKGMHFMTDTDLLRFNELNRGLQTGTMTPESIKKRYKL
jgi:hypothetical protein